MTFKPCKVRFQDQDFQIRSDGSVYWLCTQGQQLVVPELAKTVRDHATRIRRNRSRRERDQSMRDIGMIKVKGNLGGTYWE